MKFNKGWRIYGLPHQSLSLASLPSSQHEIMSRISRWKSFYECDHDGEGGSSEEEDPVSAQCEAKRKEKKPPRRKTPDVPDEHISGLSWPTMCPVFIVWLGGIRWHQWWRQRRSALSTNKNCLFFSSLRHFLLWLFIRWGAGSTTETSQWSTTRLQWTQTRVHKWHTLEIVKVGPESWRKSTTKNLLIQKKTDFVYL